MASINQHKFLRLLSLHRVCSETGNSVSAMKSGGSITVCLGTGAAWHFAQIC